MEKTPWIALVLAAMLGVAWLVYQQRSPEPRAQGGEPSGVVRLPGGASSSADPPPESSATGLEAELSALQAAGWPPEELAHRIWMLHQRFSADPEASRQLAEAVPGEGVLRITDWIIDWLRRAQPEALVESAWCATLARGLEQPLPREPEARSYVERQQSRIREALRQTVLASNQGVVIEGLFAAATDLDLFFVALHRSERDPVGSPLNSGEIAMQAATFVLATPERQQTELPRLLDRFQELAEADRFMADQALAWNINSLPPEQLGSAARHRLRRYLAAHQTHPLGVLLADREQAFGFANLSQARARLAGRSFGKALLHERQPVLQALLINFAHEDQVRDLPGATRRELQRVLRETLAERLPEIRSRPALELALERLAELQP